ncbi:MAG: hypothetical protein QE487_02965 [Fluviicola sp.]|nr:hypothetical protein [Fluviicola sp.]
MKQIYTVLFLVFIIVSGCKQPVLILKDNSTSFRFKQGETAAPLLKSEHIDFSNCDSISVSFWEIDSIFSNRIIFKQDISFVNDTLDGIELKQLKNDDKAKFHYYKAHWTGDYIDSLNTLSRICRLPSETIRFNVPLDSLAGIAVYRPFNECDGYFRKILLSYFNKPNKIFRHNFEIWKINVRNGY